MKTKYKAIKDGKYRSKLEARVAKFLEENDIPFTYECKRITLIEKFKPEKIISKFNVFREITYKPDFCLDDCYIEVKGYYTPDAIIKLRLIDKLIDKPLYVIRNIEQLRKIIRSIKEDKYIPTELS